jgi:hypothetical protein
MRLRLIVTKPGSTGQACDKIILKLFQDTSPTITRIFSEEEIFAIQQVHYIGSMGMDLGSHPHGNALLRTMYSDFFEKNDPRAPLFAKYYMGECRFHIVHSDLSSKEMSNVLEIIKGERMVYNRETREPVFPASGIRGYLLDPSPYLPDLKSFYQLPHAERVALTERFVHNGLHTTDFDQDTAKILRIILPTGRYQDPAIEEWSDSITEFITETLGEQRDLEREN